MPYIVGCTDSTFLEYNSEANTPNNEVLCLTSLVYGCMDVNASNYELLANVNQVSFEDISDPCIPVVTGCNNDLYTEYNASANTVIDTDEDGLDDNCVTLIIEGCTNADYIEYYDYNETEFSIEPLESPANVDDGSCLNLVVFGCTDPLYLGYDAQFTVDDGSCTALIVEGCTDLNYMEYDAQANTDDNSCLTPTVYGCTDADYLEYWIHDPVSVSYTHLRAHET